MIYCKHHRCREAVLMDLVVEPKPEPEVSHGSLGNWPTLVEGLAPVIGKVRECTCRATD